MFYASTHSVIQKAQQGGPAVICSTQLICCCKPRFKPLLMKSWSRPTSKWRQWQLQSHLGRVGKYKRTVAKKLDLKARLVFERCKSTKIITFLFFYIAGEKKSRSSIGHLSQTRDNKVSVKTVGWHSQHGNTKDEIFTNSHLYPGSLSEGERNRVVWHSTLMLLSKNKNNNCD